MRHVSRWKRLPALAGLVALLLALGLSAPAAEAALKGCRADPVVVLSDGTALDIQVAIGTSVSEVTEIHYTVHGPAGVRLVSAIRTPTLGFTGKETFTYIADAPPHTYITETKVRTTAAGVPVTAYSTFAATALLDGGDLLALQYQPISGYSEQLLRAVLRG